ncbi:Ornithine decarboxylase [Hondaea fermentalgiana]|uniref:Ornithine decarboxylase n=1 Tax=Hondaea fermentalgiana TaxID=2315210 RepID=A0A2R5G9I1_9STRA|nr:Ornithine decarboxylase [Hondaea fermentalgiana]|eukprot:GBG27686.1 Ornithine decarboxylase [Hondaea fermentalgiana]
MAPKTEDEPLTARQVAAIKAAAQQGLLGTVGVQEVGAQESVSSDGGEAPLTLEALEAEVQKKPFAFLYDGDTWEANLAHMREETFKEKHFMHACAVKANPLEYFLRRACELGHGAECASISEVVHSLDVGFAPDRVVFDSPCKTAAEIEFALRKGVHLNMDNLQELARVEAILASGRVNLTPSSIVGIRVNPLVGAGTIAAFSVSTGKSKFGVPLQKSGQERESLLARVVACPWINGVHVHTGSGGMGLDQLVAGVRTAVDFALEINERAGERRIRTLDMGGGLAVNFNVAQQLSDFAPYAAALRKDVPEIFADNVFDRVVTEFGAAAQHKFALLASRVEYTKSYDGGRIALIHAGSDVFMRACYCPETFVHHRVFAFSSTGEQKEVSEDERVPTDIAGPLCFAGDVVVRDAKIAPLEVGDIVALADVGGNALSIRTTHCSRQGPQVFVFHGANEALTFRQIQDVQPVRDSVRQWKCRE